MASIELHITAETPEEFNSILERLTYAGDFDVKAPAAEVENPPPASTRGRGRPRKDAQVAAAEPPATPASDAGTGAGTPPTGGATSDPFASTPAPPEPPAVVAHTKDEVQKVMMALMDKGVTGNQLNEILMKSTGSPNVGAMDPSKYNDAWTALNNALIVLS